MMITDSELAAQLSASEFARHHAIHTLTHPDISVKPELDRLTKLAARILHAPVSLISLIDQDRQLFRGIAGLDGMVAEQRETPLSHSFCKYVVAANDPLIVSHAPNDPRVCDHPAIVDLGVIAYLGVPIHMPDGQPIGALCVIDHEPHAWTTDDLEILGELAQTVEVEIALCVALNERNRTQRYLELQRQSFAAVADGSSLSEVLSLMAQAIEARIPDTYCTILRLDPADERLYTLAAPSLPAEFVNRFEGVRIGPRIGSCGTAAYFGEIVISADIETDPRWANWREVARAHHLRACWSLPIRTGSGEMFGTFAMYHREPQAPTAANVEVIREVMHAVMLVFERWHTLDRLRAGEQQLRLSEADLLAVFEHTEDAIWTVDRQLRVQRFNQRANDGFFQHHGTSFRCNQPFVEMLPVELRANWEQLARRVFAGERVSMEFSDPLPQGTQMYEVLYTPLWVEGQISGMAVFSRNITARKQAEAERLEMERNWQETQRLESLGVLAGGIAHDFNNLLTAILGNAELGLLDSDDTGPLADYFSQIALAARHGAGLTRQILAYAGRGQMRLGIFNLHDLIREIVTLLQHTLPQPVRLVTQLAASHPYIAGEMTQMKQVIMNLIINAAEASTEDDQVIIETRVRDTYLELSVVDHGVGMDEALQQRIFDPFFTTKFAGRGLGLAVVHGIVRSHHALLQLESTPGAGTRFTVGFPRVSPLHMPTIHEALSVGTAAHHAVVLVVDDDADVRGTVSQLLERLAIANYTAQDGAAALRILAATPSINLVLQDWTMPGLHGIELLEVIAERHPHVPVLLMSGYHEQQVLHYPHLPQVAGFLAKPFNVQQLREMIEQALR